MEAFGAYASDSDEERDEEPQAARPLLALQDSDSDEEAAEAAVSAEAEAGAGVVASAAAAAASKTGAEAAKPAKRKLPSALDALKSGGSKPSFLQAADTAVLELQERKLEATKPDEPPPLAPPMKKAHTTPHQISAPPGASTAGRGGSLAGKPEKKKVDVKDKVKGQRLKGQTLGGETTRWKSDEEMRLRQQFD